MNILFKDTKRNIYFNHILNKEITSKIIDDVNDVEDEKKETYITEYAETKSLDYNSSILMFEYNKYLYLLKYIATKLKTMK